MELNPQTHLKFVQAIAPDLFVANLTPSTGADCRGFAELAVTINAGTFTGGGTATITLEESSAVDGSGDAFAAWTGSAFTAISHATDSRLYLGRIRLEGRKRYIRSKLVYSGNGTDTVAVGVTFTLAGVRNTDSLTQTYGVSTS